MKAFKVTVCRFGHVIVRAESEAEAKEMVSGYAVEQIHWMGKEEQMSPFLVTYAEMQKGSGSLEFRQEAESFGEAD